MLRMIMFLLLTLAFRPFALLGVQSLPLRAVEAYASISAFGSLYAASPEAVAVLEHVFNRDMPGIGDCRVKNVRALGPDGQLVIGLAERADGKILRHVWGVSPTGERVDESCRSCRTKEIHAVITIANYSEVDRQIYLDDAATANNLRYLTGALATQRVMAQFHSLRKEA